MTFSLSMNTQTHMHSGSHKHKQVARHQSGTVVMSFHLSFIFILQFHHSLASLLPPLLSSLFVFHHLSIAPLFCFSFKLPAFFFPPLTHSHQPPFARFVSSLRLAVFIFQSFISTNVRQCFGPSSIDPERERWEREAEQGEWGNHVNKEQSGYSNIEREGWEM